MAHSEIVSNLPQSFDGAVALLFGIQLEESEVRFFSAEEDRGEPLFPATILVSEIEIKLRT